MSKDICLILNTKFQQVGKFFKVLIMKIFSYITLLFISSDLNPSKLRSSTRVLVWKLARRKFQTECSWGVALDAIFASQNSEYWPYCKAVSNWLEWAISSCSVTTWLTNMVCITPVWPGWSASFPNDTSFPPNWKQKEQLRKYYHGIKIAVCLLSYMLKILKIPHRIF